MRLIYALATLGLLTGGCSVYREATSTRLPAEGTWRSFATDADRDRLRRWRLAWDDALPRARIADAAAVAAAGELLDPDRALETAAIPAGAYRCRTLKLGAANTGMRDFSAYPWSECRVDIRGEVVSFYKMSGAQRPVGRLFPDGEARLIFLGTLELSEENAPLRYGLDQTRDMAGYLERIGEARWRIVFPWPRFESVVDVIELVPAG